jgi:hypothetical protein
MGSVVGRRTLVNRPPSFHPPIDSANVRIELVMIMALVSAFLGAITLGFRFQPANELQLETAKTLLQAALVVAGGAFAGYAVEVLRKRAERRATLLKWSVGTVDAMIDRLDVAYAKTKTLRRRARAYTANLSQTLEVATYWELVTELEEQQIELEQLLKHSKIVDERIPGLTDLSGPLKTMENYLHDIWSEAETMFAALDQRIDPATLQSSLQQFTAFASKKRSTIASFDKFADAYADARRVLSGVSARLHGASLGN